MPENVTKAQLLAAMKAIERGLDDIAAGRVASHDAAMAEVCAVINADYTPGPKTIAAMLEARKGGLEQFSSIADLMTDLNDGSTGNGSERR